MNIHKGIFILICITVLQGCSSNCTPNKCHPNNLTTMDYNKRTSSEPHASTYNLLNEQTPSKPYNKESAPGPLPIMGLFGLYFFAKKLKNKQ